MTTPSVSYKGRYSVAEYKLLHALCLVGAAFLHNGKEVTILNPSQVCNLNHLYKIIL